MKGEINLNNLQRLQMEIKGIELSQNELYIYLEESGLKPTDTYNPQSNVNKRAIYQCALSILESIANNPTLMRAIKIDDMTVSDFHDTLMNRIDQLERKIRTMPSDDYNNGNVFLLFK